MYRQDLERYRLYATVISVLSCGVLLADEDATVRCARENSADERIRCLEEAYSALADRDAGTESVDATAAAIDSKDIQAIDIERFGAPREPLAERDIDAITVSVVAVNNNAYGKLIYITDGGQQWLQTDTKNMRYRQIPFEAEIRQASAGSFFLRPSLGGVAIRVRRTN